VSVWAIVVAGGRGERFRTAGTDRVRARKQFADLAGSSVVERSTRAAATCCDGVVLVLPADALDGASGDGRGHVVVAGGTTRAESVRAGLAAVPDDAEIVVVHDAARPLAEPELFERVIGEVRRGADAAVPGSPVTDTVKRVDGARVVETVARDDLVVVQTPQAFRTSVLRAVHEDVPEASDDAALVERAGGSVVVVPGDERNLKITTPFDLVVAAAVLGDADGARR
jgi:2-C-methyl-D-erythritol 4-phosphate cytidylyltransferase